MALFRDDALNNLFGDRRTLPISESANRSTSPTRHGALKPSQATPSGQGSITPLTCADINYLPSTATGFILNQHMASLVSLVGVVRDLKPDSFVLNDRTGWVPCSLAPLDKKLLREKRPLHDGRYARVFGRIEREVSTNELGGFETGGFVVSVVHCEGLESLNAIFDHMMQTTQAKLLYITMDARYREEFGSDTVQ